MRIRDPKARFNAVWRLCKAKMVCESDAPTDEDFEPNGMTEKPKKRSHGGCGNQQPTIRKDGLKLVGTWKPSKEDEEDNPQPTKKTLTAQDVLNIFKHISDEDIVKMGLSKDYARPEW